MPRVKDSLGDRMKTHYENRDRRFFPRRGYTLVRVDGKAFHTWTRGLKRPYDTRLMECIDAAAVELCKQTMGAICAFAQSDEISMLVTDFTDIETQAWFDGNQSKIESITASVATMAFNKEVWEQKVKFLTHATAAWKDEKNEFAIAKKEPNATFDSRAWWIADPVEVENYFIWRQKDAERNSLTMLASAYATHKQLHGKGAADRHDIIYAAGDNWNNHPVSFKRGRIVTREANPENPTRSSWVVNTNTPIFSEDKSFLTNLIPRIR